jgi:hypothetical protein
VIFLSTAFYVAKITGTYHYTQFSIKFFICFSKRFISKISVCLVFFRISISLLNFFTSFIYLFECFLKSLIPSLFFFWVVCVPQSSKCLSQVSPNYIRKRTSKQSTRICTEGDNRGDLTFCLLVSALSDPAYQSTTSRRGWSWGSGVIF